MTREKMRQTVIVSSVIIDFYFVQICSVNGPGECSAFQMPENFPLASVQIPGDLAAGSSTENAKVSTQVRLLYIIDVKFYITPVRHWFRALSRERGAWPLLRLIYPGAACGFQRPARSYPRLAPMQAARPPTIPAIHAGSPFLPPCRSSCHPISGSYLLLLFQKLFRQVYIPHLRHAGIADRTGSFQHNYTTFIDIQLFVINAGMIVLRSFRTLPPARGVSSGAPLLLKAL